ncbi:hypothetical protein KW429_11505 [Vibrio fluvialis]|nr:hypothetical protein [Vibrio fluvialis]MBY7902328.1 hypothetical protein [Vibrio fluvialis]
MKASWKNKEYLEAVTAFAKIMANSRAIHVCFQGQVETCVALIMQAEQWDIDDPFYVGANSYFDQYGRIAQTGRLMKRIISNHPTVESVEADYKGDWHLVENKFRMELGRPVPTWDSSLDKGLSLTITIKFVDGTSHQDTLSLADIDVSYRQLNSTWATDPKKQLFNYLIRNIGHFELSQLVLGYDMHEAYSDSAVEQEKKQAPHKVHTLPHTETKDNAATGHEVNGISHELESKLSDLYTSITDSIRTAKDSAGQEQVEAMEKAYQDLIAYKSVVKTHKEDFSATQASFTTKQYEELLSSFSNVKQQLAA